MAKPKGIILPDMWPNLRDKIGPSLKQFDELIQSHLTRIAKTRHSLHISSVLFRRKDYDILPVQCKKAIFQLENLNRRVSDFRELFNDPAFLPIVYIALRYRLISPLYLIEERTCELIDLLESFREICITPSREVAQQRRTINDAFETLLQQVDDIFQKAAILRDEARFQEQQMTSALEENISPASNSKYNSRSDKRTFYVIKKHADQRKRTQQAETE